MSEPSRTDREREHTERLEGRIMRLLRDAGPLAPSLVAAGVMVDCGVNEDAARRAIWRLIDRGEVNPDADLRLVARPSTERQEPPR